MAWKMTHPDSKLQIEVDAEQVANYESQGWSTVSGRSPSQDSERAPDVVLDPPPADVS